MDQKEEKAKVDLKSLLETKTGQYAKIKTDIANLDKQIQQITAQAQKQKDVLLTQGLEVQGMIKLLTGELGVEVPKPVEAPKVETKSEVKEVKEVNGPVKLEEVKK